MRRITTRSFICSVLLALTAAVGAYALPIALTRPFGFKAAIGSTKQAERRGGTNTAVNTTKRPAAPSKRIFIISAGQASISSAAPAKGASDAATAIGWSATILDGRLDPSIYGSLVSQAIAQGAQGIVLDAIDCRLAQGPLAQAKAKGIKTVAIYSFDCNDPVGGTGGPALESGCMNYNNLPCTSLGKFAETYGEDQANYIIASSKNKAHVLELQDPEYTVLRYTGLGFENQIKHSGGAKITDKLNFTVSELGSKLTQLIQAELLKHPDITWIKSPYTFATIAGVEQAVINKPGKYKVMGGEGYQPELQQLQKGVVTAVNIISSDWVGWGAIDALNSFFTHKKTYPSGIGWTIADKNHNLAASAIYTPPVNYKAQFKKAWGK